MKQNCWEFHNCGREEGGARATEMGVCPAASATEADGFCDGKNGGRAMIKPEPVHSGIKMQRGWKRGSRSGTIARPVRDFLV